MSKQFLSIVAIVAIVLSVANSLMLVRANVGAARLSAVSIPQLINYQGRLTDAAGTPLTDTYEMRFCLYDRADGGSPVDDWCETQTVPVSHGVFSVLLGSVKPIPKTVFDRTDLYLGVKVGNDDEMTPRRRVVSVGYAYKAEDASNADKVDGLHASSTPAPGALFPLDDSSKFPNSVLYTGHDNGLNADKVDGLHASELAVPSGMIGMFDTGCPLGWAEVEALNDGRFPRGGNTYGTTGGSTTHDHGGWAIDTGSAWLGADRDVYIIGSHRIAPDTHLPPYITVVFCRKD